MSTRACGRRQAEKNERGLAPSFCRPWRLQGGALPSIESVQPGGDEAAENGISYPISQSVRRASACCILMPYLTEKFAIRPRAKSGDGLKPGAEAGDCFITALRGDFLYRQSRLFE